MRAVLVAAVETFDAALYSGVYLYTDALLPHKLAYYYLSKSMFTVILITP